MTSKELYAYFKVFLIVVNFLFLLIGLGILGIGIFLTTKAKFEKYQEVLDSVEIIRSERLNLIVLGWFIVIVGLYGFIVVCKESACLIKLYALFVLFILMSSIAAIVIYVVFNKNVKVYLTEQMKDRLKRFYGNSNSSEPGVATFTKRIDAIQKEEKCCGWTRMDGENFYKKTPWFKQQSANDRHFFPESCCVETAIVDPVKRDKCVKARTIKMEDTARLEGYMHEFDCSEKLTDLSSGYTQAVLGIVIAAILLQIICISCSIVIVRHISGDNALEAGFVRQSIK